MGRDTYAGTREDVQDLWPGEMLPPDIHIHAAYDGGYYNHSHPGGQTPHTHDSEGDR